MSKRIIPQSRFSGGIAYSDKEGLKSSYKWAQSVDYRSDPTKLLILPRTAKVSGTVVTDLIMDGDQYDSTDSYFYGDAGHIYKRTSAEVWSDLHTVPDSHGNGMKYYGEDKYFYYTSDTVIGRYGPMGGTKIFVDDFLGAEGGVPLNTHSLDLEADSSMYATAADSASLSITSDITIEGCFEMESLPAAAAQMVLVSKWDKNSDERSYKFDLAAVDAVFGDGGGGALTISTDTTQAPTDSACTGTAAAYSLTATNASFAVDDKILIHQSRGTGAGAWERNEIASYTAGTITVKNALKNTYISGAQVLVLPEYTNVTVNSGKTWTAKAWDGTVGGILAFLANGTVTITGTISANGTGFRKGAVSTTSGVDGNQGEGTAGAGTSTGVANGNGGGGGGYGVLGHGSEGGGGGGGNGTVGSNGTHGTEVSWPPGGVGGTGGEVSGSADLTTITFGGGGGGGGGLNGIDGGGDGGDGGGIVFFYGATVAEITGSITANGDDGEDQVLTNSPYPGGGGGAGGSVLIKAQTATLGTAKITASGGEGGERVTYDAGFGGDGGDGRIHLDYYTSYTGTTTPTLNVTQDDGLVTSTTYQLRFSVCSTDGAAGNVETLSKTLPSIPTLSQWYRYAVKWDASASKANFFVDGVDLGESVGSKTSIYDSTALFAIGASFDAAGDDENHFDGKVDDVRVFNDLRTDAELDKYKEVEIAGGTTGLVAYYQVDNSTADSSANSNTLTLVNSPTYSTDVPFASPTTRQDLDQSNDDSGQTYTLTTAIDEGATHRQTFVPTKDPQKSIEVLLAAKGTGDWTLTVHDALNREVAAKTIVNADLLAAAGDLEFVFTTAWRPVIGASYHFHLTSTVADGTVTGGTASDLEDCDFHTYYQFLVTDDFHPINQIVNKLAIGNERYLATWDGGTYTPHKLTLPAGYRIRCLGHWREYLAMGTTRGTNVEDYDQGRIFFWDGISTTYTFYIDVPQGGINSIVSGDPIYFMAGYSGDLMRYAGGIPQKILRMPKVETADTLEVNPKALSMYRALVCIGLAEDSSSTTIERGVYSYGSLDKELPATLSFDYPLSLGITTGANLEIGMLFPIGNSLFISWRNIGFYGVDSVSPSNSPFPTAKIEFLITDAGKIWAEKQAQVIRSYFKPLVTGDSIKLKYKLDRNDNWTEGTAVTTAEKKEARLPLPKKGTRFNELQVGIDLETTGSASPEIYGWAVSIDDLAEEKRV
jgi:hypothetical protein